MPKQEFPKNFTFNLQKTSELYPLYSQLKQKKEKKTLKVQTTVTTRPASQLASSPQAGQPQPQPPTDLFSKSDDEGPSEGKFLKVAWAGTKGALKYGAVGGMALGGLGAVGSYLTGNGSFRLWGLAIGAAIGGVSGAIMGASEILDRPQ